jgi:hypothetical protein
LSIKAKGRHAGAVTASKVALGAILILLLLPMATVHSWQEELGQLRSEREAVFERWRDIERTYREWYSQEIEEGMGDVKTD